MTSVEFVEGPLWYIASGVFVLGVAWRLTGLLLIGRAKDMSISRRSPMAGAVKAVLLHSLPHGGNLSLTVYHFVSGYLFHLGLFAVLLLAAPHVAFINERVIALPWPAMPRWAFIIAAEAAFAGLILLYVRRLIDPVTRQLSDADDHIGTWLTFVAMLTGCLALQEAHAGLRALHMLSVEALLIYFPFGRLMHAFTFLLARANTGATFGRRGFTP
jgi:nitrate reductase gamma subunit